MSPTMTAAVSVQVVALAAEATADWMGSPCSGSAGTRLHCRLLR